MPLVPNSLNNFHVIESTKTLKLCSTALALGNKNAPVSQQNGLLGAKGRECLLGSNIWKKKLGYMFLLVVCFLTHTQHLFMGDFYLQECLYSYKLSETLPQNECLAFQESCKMYLLSNQFVILFDSSPYLYKTELSTQDINHYEVTSMANRAPWIKK